MSRKRERSLLLLPAALSYCIACGDGILVARELEPPDDPSSEPSESTPSDEEDEHDEHELPEHPRVLPRPTFRHPRHHGAFPTKHASDAGSHALDD